jgi:alpha-ketoglutarate-dependent dioxygenase FTO
MQSNWAKLQNQLRQPAPGASPSSSSAKKRRRKRQAASGAKQPQAPAAAPGSDAQKAAWAAVASKFAAKQHPGSSGGGGGSGGGAARGAGSDYDPGPPPPYDAQSSGASVAPLLTPGMPHYERCLQSCFRGFVHQSPASPGIRAMVPAVTRALEALKGRGYFTHDVVLGGGLKLAATFVRRILVGEPGITYKYLGLRIFAFPWGEGSSIPEVPVLRRLNEAFVQETRQLVGQGRGTPGLRPPGRGDYNLILVNLMEGTDPRGGALRNAAGVRLGTDRIAVSWHADSSVEKNSSIAVLNLLLPQDRAAQPPPGSGVSVLSSVAMKCVGPGHEPATKKQRQNGGGGSSSSSSMSTSTSSGRRHQRELCTPALAVPLRADDAYFMLDTFNEHHHHAVLAGAQPRYSTTHRVAVTATDTWDYIWGRVEEALALPPPGGAPAGSDEDTAEKQQALAPLWADSLKATEELHSELEFEWLWQCKRICACCCFPQD